MPRTAGLFAQTHHPRAVGPAIPAPADRLEPRKSRGRRSPSTPACLGGGVGCGVSGKCRCRRCRGHMPGSAAGPCCRRRWYTENVPQRGAKAPLRIFARAMPLIERGLRHPNMSGPCSPWKPESRRRQPRPEPQRDDAACRSPADQIEVIEKVDSEVSFDATEHHPENIPLYPPPSSDRIWNGLEPSAGAVVSRSGRVVMRGVPLFGGWRAAYFRPMVA